MGLFGASKQKNPADLCKEWNGKLRKEGYALDRQIRQIKREEDKIKKSLKEAAKKNDKQVCTILAKEVVRSRKAVNRIYASKATLSSVQLQMAQQMATLKVSGSLQKSTEVMVAMQKLVRMPEIANTMREMSKEMTKAGILEEMIEETMESIEDSDAVEEEAAEEVDKVLWELTDGKLGEAPAVPMATPNEPSSSKAHEEDDEEEDLEDMKTRLEALRT